MADRRCNGRVFHCARHHPLAAHYGSYLVLLLGAVLVLGTMFFWWRDVIKESRTPGMHTPVVRLRPALWDVDLLHFQRGDVLRWLLPGRSFNFALFPDTQGNGMLVWPPSTIHTF